MKAIVLARMTSSRLPGKTLAEIEGEPMLALLLRRLSRASEVDQIVVATSTDSEDSPIEELAGSLGFSVHRGSRDNVLERFVGAAGDSAAVVRVTGDCPLIDPAVVDGVIRLFEDDGDAVYASNIFPRTYPKGLDVEVVSVAALRTVLDEDPSDDAREHVTWGVHQQPDRFPARSLVQDDDLGDLRWTVDTADDLEFIRQVTARLGDRRHEASQAEILAAVRTDPSLAAFRGNRG